MITHNLANIFQRKLRLRRCHTLEKLPAEVKKNSPKNSDSARSSDNLTGYTKIDETLQVTLRKRRGTVSGCPGKQIVKKDLLLCETTETTTDEFGVKTTSFCYTYL